MAITGTYRILITRTGLSRSTRRGSSSATLIECTETSYVTAQPEEE
jgi:hypothetical protein